MIKAEVLDPLEDPSVSTYLTDWLSHTRTRVRPTTYAGYDYLVRAPLVGHRCGPLIASGAKDTSRYEGESGVRRSEDHAVPAPGSATGARPPVLRAPAFRAAPPPGGGSLSGARRRRRPGVPTTAA